jgi:hypothetical protein
MLKKFFSKALYLPDITMNYWKTLSYQKEASQYPSSINKQKVGQQMNESLCNNGYSNNKMSYQE